MSLEPLYFLEGRVIHKRPVCTQRTSEGKTITVGFPVCTVSEYVDPKVLLAFFNEADKPSPKEPPR